MKKGEKKVRGSLQTGTAVEGGAGVDAVEKDATVKIRVIEDPLFERGYVVGKVFCDEDGDAWQDAGEAGVPDVEVYVDTGSYAVTDSAGKYHLQNLEPGIRAFKAAAHTLPPGSEFTTDETRLMRLSRGALIKVNFGVTCPTEKIRPEMVELAAPSDDDDEEAEEPAKAEASGKSTGISECDDFLRKYERCVDKMPANMRSGIRRSIASMWGSYRKGAAYPSARKSLARSCTRTAKTMARAYARYNCKW